MSHVARSLAGLVLLACGFLLGVSTLASAATTTTTVLDSVINNVTGQVTLVARIDACPPAGTPFISGLVRFYDGATLVGTIDMVAPSSVPSPVGPCASPPYAYNFAAIAVPAVAPGTHTYTAVYEGNTYYASSTSSAMTVVVPPRPGIAATTVALDNVVNGVTGQVTLVARIDACPPAGTPFISGLVRFYDGATLVGTIDMVTPSSVPSPVGPCASPPYAYNFAAIAVPAVAPGTHTYTAVYEGNTYYASSTSSAMTVVVPPRPGIAATTVALDNVVNGVTGQVTLVARIDACPPAGTPFISGLVRFYDGATLVGTIDMVAPSSVPSPVGPCASPPYAYNFAAIAVPAVAPGTHTYTAVYEGNTYYASSTSSAMTVVVPPRPGIAATTVALDNVVNGVTGQVTLVARIDACPPAGTPFISGLVRFYDGATLVGTIDMVAPSSVPSPVGPCASPPYAYNFAAIAVPAVAPGTHTYTAVYEGNTYYASSTSSAMTVVVPPRPGIAATTVALDNVVNGVTSQVTLVARIDACPPAGTPFISGLVRFYDGATLVGTSDMVTPSSVPSPPSPCGALPYAYNYAAIAVPAVAPGSHAYTAVYEGNTYYAPSTSSAMTVVVPPRPIPLPPVPPGTSFSGQTATNAGIATVQLSGGGPLCVFTQGAFFKVVGDPWSPPTGLPASNFPYGLVGFVTSGCTPGSTLTITMTFPPTSRVPTAYWKYGPTPGNTTPHWYQMPASILGNVVTFSIVDGGLGDDDLTANGSIADAGGPAVDSLQVVPTLSEWGLRLTMLLVACLGLVTLRRRTAPGTRR